MTRPFNADGIPPRGEVPAVVIGLDQIARLFGRTRQTIARWIRHEGFPAARLPDGVWATTPSLIDSWLLARNTLGLEAMDGALGAFDNTASQHSDQSHSGQQEADQAGPQDRAAA